VYVFDGLLILVTLKVAGVETVFKKIHAPSDNVMTFGMLWSSIFLTGSTGCALNFMVN